MSVAAVGEQNDRRHAATVCLPVGVAALACALLVWGRSYPGFPMSTAFAMLLSAVVAVLLAARSRFWAGVTTATVVVTLTLGIALAASLGGRPLDARWAASISNFEAYVAELPPPSVYTAGDSPSFQPFPSDASCPSRLGQFTLSECVSVDGGYLFLQGPDAVTDSSGIAYLPAGSDSTRTSVNAQDLTPLGGPWWSWTCHC